MWHSVHVKQSLEMKGRSIEMILIDLHTFENFIVHTYT